jgi:hypothetical protein
MNESMSFSKFDIPSLQLEILKLNGKWMGTTLVQVENGKS